MKKQITKRQSTQKIIDEDGIVLTKTYHFEKKWNVGGKDDYFPPFVRITYEPHRKKVTIESTAKADYFSSLKNAKEYYQRFIDFINEVEEKLEIID